jgi:Fe-S cluster assembly protein SufB
MNNNKKLKNLNIKPDLYGFKTRIINNNFPVGINAIIIKLLSKLKKEPLFITKFRLEAFKMWLSTIPPNWANLQINDINYDTIKYYSKPTASKDTLLKNNPQLLETFQKLGVPLSINQKVNTGLAVDAVFDSTSIVTTFQKNLAKYGVIFCSITEAINKYPLIIQNFLGSVVTSGDNFYASLNAAIFSDGSFCYIPKNTKCPRELSTYFRINNTKAGQFERTLIIAEENSLVRYLEGCTSPVSSNKSLHAAVVELIALKNAKISYNTVQNWAIGNKKGGGIYNFVTKRGLCLGTSSKISWTQVETGSAITWKYPSCILIGQEAVGEFYSVAVTTKSQQADTGTKMIHLGKKTRSKIISKGISSGASKNSYRGLVKIGPNALFAYNFSQCDSFLIGSKSIAATYPYIDIKTGSAQLQHEATISRINDEQLFYFLQRGIAPELALTLLVSHFCDEIFTRLPFEFVIEAQKLIQLTL